MGIHRCRFFWEQLIFFCLWNGLNDKSSVAREEKERSWLSSTLSRLENLSFILLKWQRWGNHIVCDVVKVHDLLKLCLQVALYCCICLYFYKVFFCFYHDAGRVVFIGCQLTTEGWRDLWSLFIFQSVKVKLAVAWRQRSCLLNTYLTSF